MQLFSAHPRVNEPVDSAIRAEDLKRSEATGQLAI
jgi:hypothetical protein